MGKILEAFLTNQLHVGNGTERKTPEHQALCEKNIELQDQLEKTLNDKQKAVLKELTESLFDEGYYAEEVKFERGFCLGALMIAEVFFEKDRFL